MAISVGGTVGAGFNLIGRRPLTVIAWGGVLMLAAIVVQVLAFLLFGLPPTASTPVAPGADTTQVFQQLGAQMAKSLGRSFFAVVIQLPVSVIISAAVMRAVIEPEDRAFASIRVGGQEGALLLLFLLYIPIGIVFILAWILGVVACVLIGGLLGRYIGGFGGGAVGAVLLIAFGLTFMWFSLRFSLAAPMTFAERRVRFFGSWTATRGEGWRLFGLAWLLVLIGIGLALALFIVFGILVFVVFGAAIAGAGGATAFQQNPVGVLGSLGPLMIIALVVFAAVYAVVLGCMQAIFAAPFAEAYRQLRGSPDVSATFS